MCNVEEAKLSEVHNLGTGLNILVFVLHNV